MGKQLLTKLPKKLGSREIFATLFILTQLALSPFVHLSEGRENLLISFITVALCLLFNIFNMAGEPRNKRLIAVALAFTLGADYGLVLLLAENAVLSMYLFNMTQLLYAVYLLSCQTSRRKKEWHLILRGSLILIALVSVLLVLGEDADELSVISLVYYANLLCNTAVAFCYFKRMPCLALGLLAFVFCDLFVGFGNLGMYFPIERGSFLYSLVYPKINVAWVFYLPSQTLIALHAVFPVAKNSEDAKFKHPRYFKYIIRYKRGWFLKSPRTVTCEISLGFQSTLDFCYNIAHCDVKSQADSVKSFESRLALAALNGTKMSSAYVRKSTEDLL